VANPVPNPVQRLRYFDGEYLRSYDFTDEQSYHIEMRRLMNRELHLYGIVHGLEIVQDADSVPATNTYFFSIKHGLAIDQLGREIVVAAPYSLTNVLTQPGLAAGNWYEVWICYQESETGLPAAGYVDCNVTNQNTRLQEGFQVQLIPTQGQSVVTPCTGVRLGVVFLIVSPSGFGLAIQNPSSLQTYNVKRHYVGIRAQSVTAPDQVDASLDPFDITAMTTPVPDELLPGYLDVHPGVFNHGNVIVKKNLVIGDDFALNGSNQSGPGYSANLPSTIPPTGNVKITSDLFLKGSFYGFDPVSNQWHSLSGLIQTLVSGLVPVTVTGSKQITISVPQSGNTAGSTITGAPINISIPVDAAHASQTPLFSVAISAIAWVDPDTFTTTWASGNPFQVSLQCSVPSLPLSTPSFNLAVTWTIGPAAQNGATWVLPITALTISYVVVLLPPS